MTTHQLSVANSLDFILGGKAIFTLKSLQTGKHFTYQVKASKDEKCFFVQGLTGSCNTDDYEYIGLIFAANNKFVHGKKSRINADAPIVKAFNFAFQYAINKSTNKSLEFYHVGKCCRCGRPLTTPESVTNGIGSDCASKRK